MARRKKRKVLLTKKQLKPFREDKGKGAIVRAWVQRKMPSVSTQSIIDSAEHHGIPLRTTGRPRAPKTGPKQFYVRIPKRRLHNLLVIRNLSFRKAATEINKKLSGDSVTHETVRKQAKYHGIKKPKKRPKRARKPKKQRRPRFPIPVRRLKRFVLRDENGEPIMKNGKPVLNVYKAAKKLDICYATLYNNTRRVGYEIQERLARSKTTKTKKK